MKSVTEPNRFYKWIAVSMMVIGGLLLFISVSEILYPREMCQDDIWLDRPLIYPDGAPCEPSVDPGFYLPPTDGFIMTVLSLCLMAFGGVIVGMIIRLQK
jgi:hypothetical protein